MLKHEGIASKLLQLLTSSVFLAHGDKLLLSNYEEVLRQIAMPTHCLILQWDVLYAELMI